MGGGHQKVNPNDVACNKGVAGLNHAMPIVHREIREGIEREGPGFSEEDESRINEGTGDVIETHSGEAKIAAYQLGLLKHQQQLPAPIVRWERFLPVRSLKVLLVENDDSTRHVVSALLRNCSYEVVAVAHGLEAWKILVDLPNHIDLVLTEVVMPCLSGVSLLSKIMSHKTCKTIPVIMMSSNDSMGIVFKCLSKGAVDFLVKPIRKNELKNLWQHVWRRCHSASGSGSESGIQNQKSTQLKSGDDSDNNTGSNDEYDNGSIGINARDGSDNGSGTQSSWTKHAIEVDSPQQMSPTEQLTDPHYSTCAQVIQPKIETSCIEVQMHCSMDCREQIKIAGNDLEPGDSRNTVARNESYQTDKISTKLAGPSMEKLPEVVPSNADVVGHLNSNALQEPITVDFDLFGGIPNKPVPQPVLGIPDTSKTFSKISESKDKEYTELPCLELSLKRLRSTVDVGMTNSDERNVLKRSNLSAFSRYPTPVASVQAPTGCGGSSVLDNSSYADPLKQGSNGSSNNNDMGSTNKNVFTKPRLYKEVPIKCNHPASAFHPVQRQNSIIGPFVQEKIDDVATAPVSGQSWGSPKQVQVQHHHHHYHHHHHHVHSLQPPPDQDDLPHKNLKATATYCSSSNVFAGPVEADAANYSLHGSNSGSNHGSDAQNGCSTAINTGGKNTESATGAAEKNGTGGGNGSGSVNGSGSGGEQNRFAQREVALNKFRLKRKARNFGKKVRYQSRQRLAEQRPRVRGQFVRRIIPGNEIHGEDR